MRSLNFIFAIYYWSLGGPKTRTHTHPWSWIKGNVDVLMACRHEHMRNKVNDHL